MEELPYEFTMLYEAAKRARNEILITRVIMTTVDDFQGCIDELDIALKAARKLLNKEK